MKKKINELIATVFYIGYIPFFPGTAASLVTVFFLFFLPDISLFLSLFLLTLLFLLGVWSSELFSDAIAKQDPSEVVIDELLGMWLSVAFFPKTLWAYVAAFIAFRFFDISKIFPINKAEKLSGGWGIMLDDVLAAFFTILFVYFLQFFIVL